MTDERAGEPDRVDFTHADWQPASPGVPVERYASATIDGFTAELYVRPNGSVEWSLYRDADGWDALPLIREVAPTRAAAIAELSDYPTNP